MIQVNRISIDSYRVSVDAYGMSIEYPQNVYKMFSDRRLWTSIGFLQDVYRLSIRFILEFHGVLQDSQGCLWMSVGFHRFL